MYTCLSVCSKMLKEANRAPRSRVTGSCELPVMGKERNGGENISVGQVVVS